MNCPICKKPEEKWKKNVGIFMATQGVVCCSEKCLDEFISIMVE